MSRRNYFRIHHHRYEIHGEPGDPCVYCGVASFSVDHVPPLCLVDKLCSVGIDPGLLRQVRSCVECNIMLGTYPSSSIRKRRAHVHKLLRKRYSHLLRLPHWTADELEDMGDDMRMGIERHTEAAERLRARLAHG